MSFDWLNEFQQNMEKPEDYAEKTLAAYKLGMKGKGSIVGVRVELGKDVCSICGAVDETALFLPDEAPRFPLEGCLNDGQCRAVYRPVMTYQVKDSKDDEGVDV